MLSPNIRFIVELTCGKTIRQYGPLAIDETAPANEGLFAGLPCPEPLPTAIEGGLFGMEVSGPIVPDAEDVASITEEHAREMVALLTDIGYLERCQAIGVAPESGRQPRTDEHRERLAARLTKELADTRRSTSRVSICTMRHSAKRPPLSWTNGSAVRAKWLICLRHQSGKPVSWIDISGTKASPHECGLKHTPGERSSSFRIMKISMTSCTSCGREVVC